MLSDGPDVSLRGSPMVSPITAALWGSDPFGPRVLAWSEAPAYRSREKDTEEIKLMKFEKFKYMRDKCKKHAEVLEQDIFTSIYFFALSHAPPVLDAEIAICQERMH